MGFPQPNLAEDSQVMEKRHRFVSPLIRTHTWALHILAPHCAGQCAFTVGWEKGRPFPSFSPSSFTFRDHFKHHPLTAPGTAGEHGLCSARYSDGELLQGFPFPWDGLSLALTAGSGTASLKHPRGGFPKGGTQGSSKPFPTAEIL